MNPTSATSPQRTWRRASVLLASGALAVGLIATLPASASDDEPTSETPEATVTTLGDGESILNMFMWTWDSVAEECASFLPGSGYTHVQVSPPQDHISGSDAAEDDAWYIHYQPTSYDLESRLGTPGEFADMVSTCNDNGIDVVVDAVINHMAAGDTDTRTSWAGHDYQQFDYPAVPYGENDFNSTGDDYCDIEDYTDRWEVQNCHLLGLNDLATGSSYSQDMIVDYLNELTGLGVNGFRVDASKHMPAEDLETILGQVNGDPYIVHEVIYHTDSGEPIHFDEYFDSGVVHMFDYADWMDNHFAGDSPASYLLDLDADWGLAPSDLAGTFISNHDTVRGDDAARYLNYYDDHAEYLLANVYMMAYPYGVPAQLTDYAFSDFDTPPPLDSDGRISDVQCDSDPWTCQHRQPEFTEMAQFRAATTGESVTDEWHNDADAFAFGRGDAGYVVINAETSGIDETFSTSLPAGEYCDVLSAGDCDGDTYTVNDDGEFTATVDAQSALALHLDAQQ